MWADCQLEKTGKINKILDLILSCQTMKMKSSIHASFIDFALYNKIMNQASQLPLIDWLLNEQEKGGVLQGQTNKQVIAMDDSKQVIAKDDFTDKAKSVCIADGKEARTLDVFWFLKPCTQST